MNMDFHQGERWRSLWNETALAAVPMLLLLRLHDPQGDVETKNTKTALLFLHLSIEKQTCELQTE